MSHSKVMRLWVQNDKIKRVFKKLRKKFDKIVISDINKVAFTQHDCKGGGGEVINGSN